MGARKHYKYWTKEEKQTLTELFPKYGACWEGWKLALPGRLEPQIRSKAHEMGLRMDAISKAERRAFRKQLRREAKAFKKEGGPNGTARSMA